MYPPTVSGPVMIYMSSSTFSFVVSTVPNCPYCSLATCGYCLRMNVMKVSFMRNITTISISLSDKRVFPSVTTWLAHVETADGMASDGTADGAVLAAEVRLVHVQGV